MNPILGETVQRVLPDGTKFFAEQTSHHPPISNFMTEGPNNCYRFSGFFEYKVWLAGMNSIAGTRLGKQILSFSDGGLISIQDPNLLLTGLAFGETIHNMTGNLIVTDHIHKLEATVTYNPQTQSTGYLKSIASKWWGGKKAEPKAEESLILTDYISIVIKQNSGSKNAKVVAEGSGSWLEYVEFGGQVYWRIDQDVPTWQKVNDETLEEKDREILLPSDASYRPDHMCIVEGNIS